MEIIYRVSSDVANNMTVHKKNKVSSTDTAEKTSKEQFDRVEISDEAARQQKENMSLDKKLEMLRKHYMEPFSNPQSLEKYRVEDPFKMDLRAPSVFGGENLFQDSSECQYEVFERWMKENAQEFSEETYAKIQDSIKNATMAMDKMNAMSGYRGTSFESVALLESSRFALENIKNTMVPENLRAEFGQFIDEYVCFNEESRNRIMEKMTPAFIVEDIGKSTQTKIYKEDLLSSQQSFYKREKEDIRDLLREYYSESSDKDKVKTKLQQYTERYHKRNNQMYSDNSLFDKGLVNLILQ